MVRNNERTLIQDLGKFKNNHLYMKREDIFPFSFGGNKARKAQLFFDDIDKGSFDCVVTYGSSSSNHCRVIANMAATRNMKCYIISPIEASEATYNSKIIDMFDIEKTVVPVKLVHETIEKKLKELRNRGYHPYFIAGGGHGNIGTQAYVDCYEEILQYEKENNVHFGYIFFASGTGTTQAGLVCGKLINKDDRKIIGISIARKNPKGRSIVVDSTREYLHARNIYVQDEEIETAIIFDDSYTSNGYAKDNAEIGKTIKEVLFDYGIPLDFVYTGKAFWGMDHYVDEHKVENENLLFIHTGGTPLFFDFLDKYGD